MTDDVGEGETARPSADSSRPQLGPRITVDEPIDERGAWIIADEGVPRARVSAPVAEAARRFTGARTVTQIAEDLGPPWTSSDVDTIVQRLATAGMLTGTTRRRTERGSGRLRFRPPLTVQLSVGDPRALFAALRPATRILIGRAGAVGGPGIVAAGMIVAIVGADDIARVLRQPVPLPAVFVLGAAIVLTTLVHEIGHGAALSRFGGVPRRIGAMLFYLAPAFFCDVTDGWRLGRRGQRVAVALAGPAVHLVCAAAAMLVSRWVSAPTAHVVLVLYALSCVVIAVLNLLPFVQLDGYLALMSALDRPHLRREAMREASEVLGGVLLGTRRDDTGRTATGGHAMFVAYGVGCRVFPVLLVGYMLYRSAGTVAGLGTVPAAAYLLTLALVLVVAGTGVARGVRAAAVRSPEPRRIVGTTVVGAALAVIVLFLIPIHPMIQLGYASSAGGTVRLVASSADQLPRPGTPIVLESNGIVLRSTVGTGTVGGGEPERETVDLAALVPLTQSTLTTPVSTVSLVDVEPGAGGLPEYGRAEYADAGSPTIGGWLWRVFLIRPLSALGSGWS